MKLYKNDSISVLILFTADSARQVAEGFDNKSGTSALSDAFLRFVGRVVNRYKQQTVSYEILNEPNSKLSPELYAALLKKASSLIRSTTSKAQIIYGGLDIVAQDRVQFNKIEKWGWSGYLQRTQELGCGSYYDYFSFHPFVFPRNPVEGGLENLITTAAKLSGKKIWITEFGYPTGSGDDYRVTEDQQAEFLVEAITLSIKTGVVEKFFLANGFRDGIGGPMTSMWSNTGIVRKDFSPKPAFLKIKTLLKSLN